MDPIQFATLTSFVTKLACRTLSFIEVDTLSSLLPAKETKVPASGGDVEDNVEDMLRAMAEGKTIEAIKLCRTITGMGLKEAKDAIVGAMNPSPKRVAP